MAPSSVFTHIPIYLRSHTREYKAFIPQELRCCARLAVNEQSREQPATLGIAMHVKQVWSRRENLCEKRGTAPAF